ncbi:hypothetical protein OAK48_00735 [Deltaproteobacteria bacterium]|nr:hypothetical protein [Deltaproteobacteria bacterium]
MDFRHSSLPQHTKGIQLIPASRKFFLTVVTFLFVVSVYFISQARPPPLRRFSFEEGTDQNSYAKLFHYNDR